MLRLLDLFSGIGGFSYAAERIVGGYQTVQFVESEYYCRRVLRKHWPEVPIHCDVCSFKPSSHMADIITAGFPCQDLSIAGKRKGMNDETRSGLVSHVLRITESIKPSYIVLENVPQLVNRGLDNILKSFAALGYDAEWSVCGCSDVGGFHRRQRVWVVAYSSSHGGKRNLQQALPWQPSLQRIESLGGFKNLRAGPAAGTPKLLRGTDGLPNKLDRLHALGNAVVPAVAAIPLARVAELEKARAGPDLLARMLSFNY